MHMSLQPQEVEVFYILPALRRELAIALKEQGKTQKQIAQLLGVTEAAISQYLNAKRATTILPHEFKELVFDAAIKITDKHAMIREIQLLLTKVRNNGFICKLHEQFTADIPKGCDLCYGTR